MGCEAGLKPKEFWRSTIPEIISMIYGYQKRLYHDYTMNRALRYHIVGMFNSNIPEVYDWEPLEGDPTKEEREAAKKREAEKASIEYLTFKKFYEQHGVEVM